MGVDVTSKHTGLERQAALFSRMEIELFFLGELFILCQRSNLNIMQSDEEWNLQVEDLLSFLDNFRSSSYHKPPGRSNGRTDPQLHPHVQESQTVEHRAGPEKENTSPSTNDAADEIRKEAEESRQQAREWAQKMRIAVTRWLDDDRKVASQHNSERDHALEAYKNAIAKLEEKVRRLEAECKGSLKRYLEGEQSFRQIIQTQQSKILELERQLIENNALLAPKQDSHKVIATQNNDAPVRLSNAESKQNIEAVQTTNPDLLSTTTDESSLLAQSTTQKPTAYTPRHTRAESRPAMTPGERSVPISPDSLDPSAHSGNNDQFPVVVPSSMEKGNQPVPRSPSKVQPAAQMHKRPRRRHLHSPRGHVVIQYGNGATKETRPDGTIIVRFANGDIQTSRGHMVAYYYRDSCVFSVGRPDGSIVWEFPGGQLEQHWPNGRREVLSDTQPPQDSVMLTTKEVVRLEELELLAQD